MGIRISEMEEATTFGADDYVPIVTSGTNKKALGQKIKDFIAGFFVSKSGDTMSGDLTVEKSNGDFVSKNPNITINTSANNGVTSSQTEGFMIKDSANNNIARFISVQETTGDVTAQISAFNKKTDGTATNNYINVKINKDGTSSYTVSDPAAFIKALGINIIKTSSISTTTSSSGNIATALTAGVSVPLFFDTGKTSITYSFGINNSGKIMLHFTDGTGNTLPNTSISGTLYYIVIADLSNLLA